MLGSQIPGATLVSARLEISIKYVHSSWRIMPWATTAMFCWACGSRIRIGSRSSSKNFLALFLIDAFVSGMTQSRGLGNGGGVFQK